MSFFSCVFAAKVMVEIFGSCTYNKKEHEQRHRNMYQYDANANCAFRRENGEHAG